MLGIYYESVSTALGTFQHSLEHFPATIGALSSIHWSTSQHSLSTFQHPLEHFPASIGALSNIHWSTFQHPLEHFPASIGALFSIHWSRQGSFKLSSGSLCNKRGKNTQAAETCTCQLRGATPVTGPVKLLHHGKERKN